jgi:hypothetical protein
LEPRPATLQDTDPIRQCALLAYDKYVSRIGRQPAPMVADFNTLIRDGHVHVLGSRSDGLCGYVVFFRQTITCFWKTLPFTRLNRARDTAGY